jgi:hypothetical protein
MTMKQMHDFSVGSEAGKPQYAPKPAGNLRASLNSHPNAARLGTFLHPKKTR